MILRDGPSDAVSFTDDTSLDARTTEGSKVSIHCQVLRERRLDWYYSLLRHAPVKLGELKASDVTGTFLSLSTTEQRNIFSTLRSVRVHITDPRPYIADVDRMLARIIHGVNVNEFLTRLEEAQKDVAERVHRESRRFMARQMLIDSPAERLKRLHRAMTLPDLPEWMMPHARRDARELDFDYSSFEDRKVRVNIKQLSVSVSKSSSVFFPALDSFYEAGEHSQWPATAWDFWSVNRVLCESHAFDDGNRKAVMWIDRQRCALLSRIDPYLQLSITATLKPLEVIGSADSFFVQAADIAAGIVRTIWERQSLVSIAQAFEYVTYNGSRIGATDAVRVTADLISR